MSLAIAHFASGAAMTGLVVAYLVPRAPYPRTLMGLGGIWAMLPDVYWVSPAYAPELREAHHSVWMNVFWFHQGLDVMDPADSKLVAAGCIAFLLGVTFFAERREYRALARVRESVPADHPLERG